MRLTIHQPAYMPWLGLMSKIQHSDLYVCLNHVQFEKGYFDNRNKILVSGKEKWITVPVKTSGLFKNNPLNKIETLNDDWKASHNDLIQTSYKHSGNKSLLESIDKMYKLDSNKLFTYADASLLQTKLELNIFTDVVYSSDYDFKEKKSNLILEICKKFNATEYLSGPQGRDYLDKDKFKKAGIKVLIHSFNYAYNLAGIHYLLSEPYMYCLNTLNTQYKIEEL